MTRNVLRLGVLTVAVAALTLGTAITAGAGGLPPVHGTLVVNGEPIEPGGSALVVPGETITIQNLTDDDDSTCQGGMVDIDILIEPSDEVAELYDIEPFDGAGNWETEWTVPTQDDIPDQDISGPYPVDAFCGFGDVIPQGAGPLANPEFEYELIYLELAEPLEPLEPIEPIEELELIEELIEEIQEVEAVRAAPRFTG